MPGLQQDSVHLIRSVVVIFLLLGLTWEQVAADDWDYESAEHGPDKWYLKYQDCAGFVQSPINIDSSQAIYDRNLQPFDFSDYWITDHVHMTLENLGGHTAEVILFGRQLFLKGGSLPDVYKLEQVHFHWGLNQSRGSEHKIDGKAAPLEAHFVHRQRRFPNMTVAAPHPHGLAVVALLYKVGKRNVKYDQLLQHFDDIKNADAEVEIPTFPISDLLPTTLFDYYRYYGSLTTPPCYESVIWSVATDPVEVSSDQIERFRSLLDGHKRKLVDDFRPVQPLNQRSVTTTKNNLASLVWRGLRLR